MRATHFVFHPQQNLGRRFGTSKMHLSPSVAEAAVRSEAVFLLLSIYCLLYFPLFVWVLCLSFLFITLCQF